MKKTALLLLLVVNSIIVFSQETKDFSLCKTQKTSGKYIFLNAEPVQDYEVSFEIEINFVWSSSQINSIQKISNLVLDKAFKISKKNGREFDAIIIGNGKKDIAIKFK